MYFLSLLTLFSVVFTAKFLHLTDIHLDLIYKASSKVIRQCHSGDGRADIFGEHECDSPLLFVNEVFLHLSKVASEVDFVIISGDLIR